MSERLTDDQRADWLRLIRSENVGPRTFRALLNQIVLLELELAGRIERHGGGLVSLI